MDSDESPLDESHSVTRFIERLKDEDPQAAGEIWRRYFERLLPVAKARLRSFSDRAVDEEDILVSVFERFFRAARENRFARLHDRQDLWQILLMLTERTVTQQFRRSQAQKRGTGRRAATDDRAERNYADIREIADAEPGPEFVAAFNDNLARALTRLDAESTREVALQRMEGFENREIAERLGISLSSVERKLRLIREVWQDEFGA
jgi:RNA polymerase sigma factor (sigma-70 family)